MVGILLLALICSQIPSSSQKINSTILKEYDRKICDNEATCSWLSKYQIPEERSTLKRRNCMCDEECKLYKDCCMDSPYYDDVEQRDSSEFYCPQTEKVYMKAKCASSWPSDHINDLCRKSTKVLDSDNVLVLVPVTNPETGITYGNLYCAICNYDRNYISWNLIPACAESSVPSSTTPQNQFKTNNRPNSVQNIDENRKKYRLMVVKQIHSMQSPSSEHSYEPVAVVNREPNRNTLFQPMEQFRNPQVSYVDAPFQSTNAIPNGDYQTNDPNLYFGGSGAQDRFNGPFYWNQPTNPPPIFSSPLTNSGFDSLQKKSKSWNPETSYTRSPRPDRAFGHIGTQEENNNDPFFKTSENDTKIILNIFVHGNRNRFANEDQGAEINVYYYDDSARRKRQTEVGLDFNKYAEESPEIWKSVMFDPTTKQLRSEYQGKNFVCKYSVKVPSFLDMHTRPCIPKVIDKCKDESHPDLVKACRSHTMIVWNKNTKQPYRNKACALCNEELESNIAACLPGGRGGLGDSSGQGSKGIDENGDPSVNGIGAENKLG